MNNIINVLIVDDHPIIIGAYRLALEVLSKDNPEFSFCIHQATEIDEAVDLIENKFPQNKLDLLFLDISMPKSIRNNLHSGEDLGLYIKAKIPDVKILTITALNDVVRLIHIVKNLNPLGLLVKSDLTNQTLISAIKSVLKGQLYYSDTIVKMLQTTISQNVILDELDILLLMELANGAKMKELQELLPLTKSGIDKRKRLLKEKFELDTSCDRDLVITAKEKGFI
ncbi:MAG: response regulator [Flavobacteriaceae bacterium]|uniref:response regulator n=1 Tax=Bizionia echini TaxID=649333 RepID=UPI000C8C637B|nr:response regulator [Flavobacteriaceae bacterium]|tara:strand:- start:942 stop:1619 length:678 start_codon:yes stop_codon:yes gene_type:complete